MQTKNQEFMAKLAEEVRTHSFNYLELSEVMFFNLVPKLRFDGFDSFTEDEKEVFRKGAELYGKELNVGISIDGKFLCK